RAYPLYDYPSSLSATIGDPSLARSSHSLGDSPARLEDYMVSLSTDAGIPWATLGRLSGDVGRPEGGTLRTDEVLGDWAARFARSWKDRVQFQRTRLYENPKLIYVLRGDNPELRPAIRLALTEAVPEDNGLAVLATIAPRILPIPTADLHPDAVPSRNSPDARQTLVQLVEYVDR